MLHVARKPVRESFSLPVLHHSGGFGEGTSRAFCEALDKSLTNSDVEVP